MGPADEDAVVEDGADVVSDVDAAVAVEVCFGLASDVAWAVVSACVSTKGGVPEALFLWSVIYFSICEIAGSLSQPFLES